MSQLLLFVFLMIAVPSGTPLTIPGAYEYPVLDSGWAIRGAKHRPRVKAKAPRPKPEARPESTKPTTKPDSTKAAPADADQKASASDGAKPRGLWNVERVDKVVKWGNGKKAHTIMKDSKTGLWWSRDTAKHGGSEWKVYKETSKGLEHFADADKHGDFLTNKHKGDVGKFIPWRELNQVNGAHD
jgi:hypothetical protein